MTTKGPLRKQIIVPMGNDNKTKFIALSSDHIANLNRVLKNIKSNIMADYAYMDQNSIIIVTNKITSSLDFQMIENYTKNIEYINSENIETSCLSQLKFYSKIIDILYLMENTDMPISLSVVESILNVNYIFNNMLIILKPYVIKTSPQSDMAIVWLDIWDVQSSSKAKSLINRCFNVESHISKLKAVDLTFSYFLSHFYFSF